MTEHQHVLPGFEGAFGGELVAVQPDVQAELEPSETTYVYELELRTILEIAEDLRRTTDIKRFLADAGTRGLSCIYLGSGGYWVCRFWLSSDPVRFLINMGDSWRSVYDLDELVATLVLLEIERTANTVKSSFTICTCLDLNALSYGR